jgi:SSS family solute:Na+ symporter
MAAVIWTDVVQTIVLVGGTAACAAILLWQMPQGPGELVQIAAADRKFSLGSYGPDVGASTVWVVLLYGVFINLQNFGIDQSYVQRYQTARSDRAARRSVWLGALLYMPISAAFLFIGTALFAFYSAQPGLLPAEEAARPDAVFPHFIATELPAGLAGLVIAAVFAAAQSTVSSSVNCAATLMLCDVYTRYLRPAAAERERLLVLRASSLAFGAAGILMALAMMSIRSALDAWWQLASIFSGGMLGLFLLGLLSRGARSLHAAAGVAVGVLLILWMTFSPSWAGALADWRSPFHPNLIIVIGTLSILGVGLLAARAAATAPAPAAARTLPSSTTSARRGGQSRRRTGRPARR